MLKEYSIEIPPKDKKVADYYPEDYVRQKPNKKFIGKLYPYVRIYNIVDPVKHAKREEERRPKEEARNRKRLAKGKEPKEKTRFDRWLMKIGEEPVIYSALQTRKSSQQITKLLQSKGYYNAQTKDSVNFKGKYATVKYKINAGKPYTVRNYTDSIEDPEVAKLLEKYFEEKSQVKPGENVDVSYFDAEREKINEIMLENGYYRFAKEYIFFQIDTFVGNYQADVKITIKSPVEVSVDGVEKSIPHKKYYFKDISIYPDHEPTAIIKKKKEETITYDTVPGEKNIKFLIGKKNKYTQAVLTRGLTIENDSLYRASKSKGSFTYYSSLANFRLINFSFAEPDENSLVDDTTERNYLNTHIRLTPQTPQSFTVELEGNNTAGHFGMATNLLYRHINIFGGAEILDIKGKLELNNQDRTGVDDNVKFSDKEIGVTGTLRIPNFVMPFSSRNFYLKYYPKTAFSLGFNFRFNNNYKRTIFSSSFGYDWRASEKSTTALNLLEFSSVRLSQINPEYAQQLDTSGQFTEKYDHLILGSSFTYTYSTQNIKKSKNFYYLLFRFEPAGNLLNLLHQSTNMEKKGFGDYFTEAVKAKYPNESDSLAIRNEIDSLNQNTQGFHTLFDIPYAQYAKAEVDFRYYHILNSKNEMVYRINPGIIVPYGNSFYSPQEKRFFLGGASSMRAWQARRLGPGSYSDSTGLYQYGDIKLEMNLEYRFNILWMIDGALFLDAGNIWALSDYRTEESKKFKLSEFHKEIALGTGVGLRLDFSFFVFRFDFGLKMLDPAHFENKKEWFRFSPGDKWYKIHTFNWKNDFAFNFGIGYPF